MRRTLIGLLLLMMTGPPSLEAATIFAGLGNSGYFSDAMGLSEALRDPGGYGGMWDVYLYEDLDGPAIVSTVMSLGLLLRPSDTLIWYYSGHGGWRSDQTDRDETAPGSFAVDRYDETMGMLNGDKSLADDELAQAFMSISDTGASVVTILDMCYAGGFIGGALDLNRVSGLTFFASSTETEDSYRYENEAYSIFTQGLISGLLDTGADRDGDGMLLTGEWFTFAADYTRGRTDDQHPVFWGDGGLTVGAPAPVPLPGAFWLLGSGLAAMLAILRRNAKDGVGVITVHDPR
jgi:hypothetical protein